MSRYDEIVAELARAEQALENACGELNRAGPDCSDTEARNLDAIIKGREATRDLLRAKRANLIAGMPEDFGIKAPIDIEAVIERRLAEMQAKLNKRFKAECLNMGKYLAQEFNKFCTETTAAIQKKADDLSALRDEIMTRGIRYKGYWQPSQVYSPGDMVTFGGSLWHCNSDTTERPAETPDCTKWTLAARKGRDGKDLR